MGIIYSMFFIGLLFIDLRSKNIVQKNKVYRENRFCTITYSENYGIALNILEGKRLLIISVNTIIVAIISIYSLYSMYTTTNYLKNFSLLLIIAGGIGNLIDRVTKGFVVDFIIFKFKCSPIFNIADFYIMAGQLSIICLLFLGNF
ncbi:MAG: signal peptidase II [Clostridium sp.]